MNAKSVLICGDRNWTKRGLMKRVLLQLKGEGYNVIIEGEARGADRLAGELGYALGFKLLKFPADWQHYGRAAGVIRNKEMLVSGKPSLVVGFHEDINSSKGTKNMLHIARKAGIKTILIDGKKEDK